MSQRDGRALFLARRDELLQQAASKLHQVAPALDTGLVKPSADEHGKQIVLASVQTLSRPERLARVTADFTTVICDEAHRGTAGAWQAVLAGLGCFSDNGPLTVGITATAERTDGAALGSVCQEIVYQRGILQMISEGYLCDVRACPWSGRRGSHRKFVLPLPGPQSA